MEEAKPSRVCQISNNDAFTGNVEVEKWLNVAKLDGDEISGPIALHGTTFLALLLHRLCLAEGGMLEPVVEGFWQGINGLG